MRPHQRGVPDAAARTLVARHVPGPVLAEVAERAWALADEGLATGRMTRADGSTIELTPQQFLQLVQWAAGYRQQGKTQAVVGAGLVAPSDG